MKKKKKKTMRILKMLTVIKTYKLSFRILWSSKMIKNF